MYREKLLAAAKAGNIIELSSNLTKDLLSKDYYILNYTMMHAAGANQMTSVRFCINLGAKHFNAGLNHACLAGHLDMVKFMIEKGANDYLESIRDNPCWEKNGTNIISNAIRIWNIMMVHGIDFIKLHK
jgi:hypothetical protein